MIAAHVARRLVALQPLRLARDRFAAPVVHRRLVNDRPAAPVQNAPDNLVLRVVVRHAHVESGEALHPLHVLRVARRRHRVEVERRQPFAGVLPVEGGDELLVEHPILRRSRGWRLGRRVLPDVPFPDAPVHFEHRVGCTEGMQQRPGIKRLHYVVRPVVAAPTFQRPEVAAVVHVLGRELARRLRIGL